MRLHIAPLTKLDGVTFSTEVSDRLTVLMAQMKTLSEIANKARYGEGKDPSIPRLQSVLDEQKESVVLAIAEAKGMIGAANE